MLVVSQQLICAILNLHPITLERVFYDKKKDIIPKTLNTWKHNLKIKLNNFTNRNFDSILFIMHVK